MLSLVHFPNVYYVYINFTEGNYLEVGGYLTGSTAGCSFSLLAFLAFSVLLVTGYFRDV